MPAPKGGRLTGFDRTATNTRMGEPSDPKKVSSTEPRKSEHKLAKLEMTAKNRDISERKRK